MFKALGDRLKAGLGEKVKAFAKDPTFMRATMAGAALVAASDGTIGDKEKKKLRGFIERSDDLKHFDSTVCIQTFNGFADELEFDIGLGRDKANKALDALAAVRNGQDQRNTLLRVVVAVANASGAEDEQGNPIPGRENESNIDDKEAAEIRRIASRLGLDAGEYLQAA